MLLEAQWIKQTALALGLDACGLAVAAPIPRSQWGLTEWLADGRQADMHYMEEHVPLRYDPTLLLPGARTVISVLLGYKPSSFMQGPVKIAQYAYGEDYHEQLKRLLYQLLSALSARYPGLQGRPFVDTAPISDKYWAVQAGLGWRGKNTLLINPLLGSYCYIGELVVTLPADTYDSPLPDPSSPVRCPPWAPRSMPAAAPPTTPSKTVPIPSRPTSNSQAMPSAATAANSSAHTTRQPQCAIPSPTSAKPSWKPSPPPTPPPSAMPPSTPPSTA